MDTEDTFFDFAGYVGLTKHLGGVDATDALVHMCQINEHSYILDVGCGAGLTPCYIAKKFRCRVVGVDINAAMLQRSIEESRRQGVAHLVEFKTADAQDLPFEDEMFDVVMTESVTAFPEDKPRAVREYVRVTKPGGYVGLNEGAWLKTPVPPEVEAWASQDLGANVAPLTRDEWVVLMENAGLHDISARIFPVEMKVEAQKAVSRYGWRRMIRILSRTLVLYFRNPAYRKFLSDIRQSGITPDNLVDYFGYGLFVGQK